MNSKSNGQVTIITAQPSDSDHFVGYVYEFAIVMENKNREELINELREAAEGYLQVVRENNLSDKLLDKHNMLPKDLQELYNAAKGDIDKQPSNGPVPQKYKHSLKFGLTNLSTAHV
jgi:hypothetical protein